MAGAADVLPVIRLGPDDVVQDSIKQVRWTTNSFAVKWRYTEAGAKRMLEFWGQYPEKKVIIQVGAFKTPPFIAPGAKDPVTHSDWKEGWLARRTDTFFDISEADAKAIIAGLKGG